MPDEVYLKMNHPEETMELLKLGLHLVNCISETTQKQYVILSSI